MSVVEAILALVFILATSVISSCLGFSDGYKLGRSIGRDEGVVLGLKRAISIMRRGGDAE